MTRRWYGCAVGSALRGLPKFRGFDHNDALKSHMATYVKYQMRDDCWSELEPQVERNDRGNSHARMLETYVRMLASEGTPGSIPGVVAPRSGQTCPCPARRQTPAR
jgi:hypothetical protein